MSLIITIIAFILMLGITVAIHETGHMFVAKLCGVYVHEYSLGMGPKLWEKKGKETTYQLRALPIGGFVSMAGEDVNKPDEEKDVKIPENRKFYNQPYWKKVCILLAGVTMNFLLAICIFSIVVYSSGGYAEPIPATVTTVFENSPAERAGFLPGDQVVRITKDDGSSLSIERWSDISIFLVEQDDEHAIIYDVIRDGQTYQFTATPEWSEEDQTYLIGIQGTSSEVHEVKWYNCLYYGFRYFIDSAKDLFVGLKMLFMKNGFKQVSGPVGIASLTGEVVSHGFIPYLYLIGILNLNIGIMNLLPLPVLDGGQIIIETIEKIIRRRIPDKVKVGIMAACWILLICLMLTATLNDIGRIFN